VKAPEGIIVKIWPEQMDPLFTVTVGVTNVVTELTAARVLMQPAVLVPVTLYVELVSGVTVALPELKV
jgi:hypothetical protein